MDPAADRFTENLIMPGIELGTQDLQPGALTN
jgi:hypothetical protein